eukprot:COSAG06_NODE_38720_length_420_cov_1.093458_1_plen_91_part_00
MTGNDDGYGLAGDAEDDIAQLYIRDVITAASQGAYVVHSSSHMLPIQQWRCRSVLLLLLLLLLGATGGCYRWVLLAGCCWVLLALCSTAR